MDLLASESSESRFLAYVEGLVAVIGHADRAVPLHDYCLGLLMPGERKSVEPMAAVIGQAARAVPLHDSCRGLLMRGERKGVEPMAAVTAPARVAAQHQSLLHFVGNAPWSDERVLARVRELVLPTLERRGP